MGEILGGSVSSTDGGSDSVWKTGEPLLGDILLTGRQSVLAGDGSYKGDDAQV